MKNNNKVKKKRGNKKENEKEIYTSEGCKLSGLLSFCTGLAIETIQINTVMV